MSYRIRKSGKPEFEPTSVREHRGASKVNRLHMRALHLATVKQQDGGTR